VGEFGVCAQRRLHRKNNVAGKVGNSGDCLRTTSVSHHPNLTLTSSDKARGCGPPKKSWSGEALDVPASAGLETDPMSPGFACSGQLGKMKHRRSKEKSVGTVRIQVQIIILPHAHVSLRRILRISRASTHEASITVALQQPPLKIFVANRLSVSSFALPLP
jgi:hypothetical protein